MVSSVPPRVISGSASFAMAMKEWQDTAIACWKPASEQSPIRPCRSARWYSSTRLSGSQTAWSAVSSQVGCRSRPVLTASVNILRHSGAPVGASVRKQRAAEEAFEQAKAQYRSTVLTALQNVADSLRALQADANALHAAVASEHAAARSLEIVRRQLALGQVAYL